jgi:hypothetical protein
MSIQANELRIGNWVTYHDPDEGDMPCRIDGTDIAKLEIDDDYRAKHSPIELTPEILEKCGFSKTSYDGESWYEYEAKNGIVFCEDDKNGYCEVSLDLYDCIRVKYVHELQNLYFALTGKEIKINI